MVALVALGCSGSARQAAAPCPTTASTAPNDASVAGPAHEARVDGKRLSFVFRASRWSNLLYQLDCLAHLMPCSVAAYELEWAQQLGGLSKADRAAIARWRSIRYRYQGRIEIQSGVEEPELPIPRGATGVEAHIRLAAYAAAGPERYPSTVGLFMEPADVHESAAIIARFSARYARAYEKKDATLAAQASELAERIRSAQLDALVERVAAFYGSDLPPHTELTFELLSRPKHDSASYGQNRGRVSFVEIVPGEKADPRLAVVMHELFHFFFATAKRQDAARLANRFAESDDPLAYPAWGLLDESLAAAFGNGMVLEKLDSKELQRRLARPYGLYSDEFIDPVARKLLPRLPALLDNEGGLFSDELFQTYLALVHESFPHGLPPRAYLRPWVCLYQPSLESAYEALGEIAHSPMTVSESSVVPRRTNNILESRARWTRVIMLRRADLENLSGYRAAVGEDTVTAVLARAKKPGAFVVARATAPVAFVFVADEAALMKRLVERFSKVSELSSGVLLEGDEP